MLFAWQHRSCLLDLKLNKNKKITKTYCLILPEKSTNGNKKKKTVTEITSQLAIHNTLHIKEIALYI